MRYKIFQKTDGGEYILIGRAVENIEDDEVYLSYKDGEARAFELREFFEIFSNPFFVLESADKPAMV